jgi:hypothetical protein
MWMQLCLVINGALEASTKWYDNFPSPLEAEAMGLSDAISWFDQLRLSKV